MHAQPLRQADITCDSDGVLNRFISTRDAVDFDPILPLHELRDTEPYPLAMFLTGASSPPHHLAGAMQMSRDVSL